uniref:Si:dkeyp-97b10.3 n=1 Tax=Oryzias latipes TaxID=8090 RepID=A0A3P9HDH2_ORYLA
MSNRFADNLSESDSNSSGEHIYKAGKSFFIPALVSGQVSDIWIYLTDNPGTSTEDSSEEDDDEEEEEEEEEEDKEEEGSGERISLTGFFTTLIVNIGDSALCFRVQLEADVSYECSATGLVFEATEPVLVRYSILSWSKFAGFLGNSWKFAGPIFNVETVKKDASVLKSIQFPHCVCLARKSNEGSSDMTFGILHVKGNRPLIEPTVDHSGSHVKWNVTSLSPVGPIIQTPQPVDRHGVVLVYKQLGSSSHNYSFHIYLATNSASDIKDIAKQVRACKNRYIKIDKPPTCKLDEGTYRLLSEPEGDIKPQELNFTLAVTKMKGYFEAFFEQPPPFKLSLIETNTEETVWSATIREGTSISMINLVFLIGLPSNPAGLPMSVTECDRGKKMGWNQLSLLKRQLLLVANQLGKEWKQVAIFLDWTSKELDNIQAAEKDVVMQKHKMLVGWKNRRRPGEATAYHLWDSIKGLDLPNEVYQILRGKAQQKNITLNVCRIQSCLVFKVV